MTAYFISTLNQSNGLRGTVARLQKELDKATQEASTGQYADAGRELGARSARIVAFQGEMTRLNELVGSNAVTQTRLASTQTVLDDLIDAATSFRNDLLLDHGDVNSRAASLHDGASNLERVGAALNTYVSGRFIFAGEKSDVAPFAGVAAGNAASEATFAAEFGFSTGAASTQGISASAMSAFLDGGHASLYGEAAWKANWSAAGDNVARSRISPSESINSSISANEPAFRKLAGAFSMLADFGGQKLNDEAYRALTSKAVATATDAINGLTQLSARNGAATKRLDTATTRVNAQITLLTKQSDALQSVDPYEAATRVSHIQTQIQAAFYMTSQLRDLKLFKYL